MHCVQQETTIYLKMKILRCRIAKGSLCMNSPYLLIELNKGSLCMNSPYLLIELNERSFSMNSPYLLIELNIGSFSMNSPYLLIELNKGNIILSQLWKLGYRMYNFQDSSTSPSSSSFPACTSVSFPFILLPLFLFTCQIMSVLNQILIWIYGFQKYNCDTLSASHMCDS